MKHETITDERGLVIRFTVDGKSYDFAVRDYQSGKAIKQALREQLSGATP